MSLPGAKCTKGCSALCSLGAEPLPRVGTAPRCHQTDGSKAGAGNVCVWGGLFGWDGLGIQAPSVGFSGTGIRLCSVFAGAVLLPVLPSPSCSWVYFGTESCVWYKLEPLEGEEFIFGRRPLWGGVASQVTMHFWDQCVNPKEVIPALSPASGNWEVRKKRFTDHGFASTFLEHPKSCVCSCGKIHFCHQELSLTFSLQSRATGAHWNGAVWSTFPWELLFP